MHWPEKKAQGRALGLPLRGSPIARISPPRKMIKHGRKMASKAKKRSVLHGRHSGSRAMVVMGVFPSPSKVPPKRNRKPRLTPRVRGFTYETLTSE